MPHLDDDVRTGRQRSARMDQGRPRTLLSKGLIRLLSAAAAAVVALGVVVQGSAAAAVTQAGGDSDRSVTVARGAVASLVLNAARSSVPVGVGVSYAVGARDAAGRDLGDVTSLVQLSISPEGTCVRATCTARRAGPHAVTATFGRGRASITGTTVLHVALPPSAATPADRTPRGSDARPDRSAAQPAPSAPRTEPRVTVASPPPREPQTKPVVPTPRRPAPKPSAITRLELSPARTFTAPGHAIRYTAIAYDATGRSLGDVTSRTEYSITFTARDSSVVRPGGSCAGATCTPTRLGRHTVTGTFATGGGTVTGTAELQVVPRHRWPGLAPRLASIELLPRFVVTQSGIGVTYVATGYDAEHRSLGDVTALTTFSISPGGTCVGSTCTATTTQTRLHTVTGTVRFTKREVTATATQLVTPPLAALEIRPRDVLTEVGRELAYTAYGLDGDGRRVVDLTGFTTFSMGGAGACTGSSCTPAQPGRHGVTGRAEVGGRILSDTAPVRAIPRIAAVAITPDSTTARSGEGITYAVHGVDEEGEPLVDLTGDAVFTMSSPGSCTGSTCTAAAVGDHTVHARVVLADRTESDTTRLHVIPVVVGLRLSGPSESVSAGDSITYVATGLDEEGRPVADLTADVTFTISSPGTCDGSTCTATRAQAYTVTASVPLAQGELRASTTLEVVPGPVDRLFLDPSRATATAGESTAFTAFGVDAYGNRVDRLAGSTALRITAPGTCTGFSCTATRAQDYTVSLAVAIGGRELRQTATLEVLPGPLESLRLEPSRATATAGEVASFRAHGIDAHGNSVGELTHRASFTITAPGSCAGATCTARAAQTYTVTGTVDAGRRVAGTAVLVVAPGPLETLVLDPPAAVITGDGSVVYTAHGADAFGNRLGDVTDRTTITIDPDGGSCRAATCATRRLGRHTVTGTTDLGEGPVRATAQLLALATPVATLRLNPRSATIHPDGKANFTAAGLDAAGRVLVDLTDYTAFTVGSRGTCRLATCTAKQLGTHTVTGSVVLGDRAIGGGSVLSVVPRPASGPGGPAGPSGPGTVDGDVTLIRGLELSPEAAEIDAGVPLRYVAVGVDADGIPLREVTGESSFTIRPDGSCSRSACTAATPGPHTVTATIGGPAGTVTGSVTGTVTVDRAGHVRTPLALRALDAVTGSASLSVNRALSSCLISPRDVRSITTATQDGGTGTSVRVDGAIDPAFAACPVVVLLDGAPLGSATAVGADGRVSAAAVVPVDADRSGVADIVTIDGTRLATVAYRIPARADSRTLLWLLFAGLLLVAAAAVIRARARRQRRWVREHVQLNPVLVPARVSAAPDRTSPPSFTVRLRPQGDPGTIAVTEEGHR